MLPMTTASSNEPDTEDGFIYEIEAPSFGNAEGDDDRIVVKKSELISNKSNEIVILNSSEKSIYFVSNVDLVNQGIVTEQDDRHRSELLGHSFYKFVDGITVYSKSPLIME